jgi:phenol hydroxylase P5 protein
MQLTIEPLGETIDLAPGQTLLDACLRAGIYLPHACGHGLCGTCKVSVLEGEVDHGQASSFALMDFERDEGRTLACSARARGDVTIEADIDEDPDAEHHPVRDFTGKVSRIVKLTPDIRGIWLRLPAPGIAFQAGQYVNVAIPGLAEPRAFSIASSPADGCVIELHVRLVPGGAGTKWLHETLKEGDALNISGPYGRFYVRHSISKPRLFLAGGSGLSSPKSMILDLLDREDPGAITLLHGARRPHDLHFRADFEALALRHENFRYLPVLSAAQPEDGWQGMHGFVHEAAERLYNGRFAGMQAYLCGPPPMIEACIGTLMRGRLFEADIFTERFVTAGDAGSATRSPLFKRL